MQTYVAVIGSAEATPEEVQAAREVGRLLAEHGCVVVCGGLGGVMAAAADGVRSAGGISVGLLPGPTRREADEALTVAIPTGLGQARNALVVGSADGVIAVGGSWGTLSEVALAVRTGVAVVSVGGWQVHDASGRRAEIVTVATPTEAVSTLLALVRATPG